MAAKPDAVEREPRLALGVRARQRFQAEHHIGEIGEMREQREVLEHQPDAAPLRRLEARSPATSRSLIRMRAGARPLDAGGKPQQRRLAASGRTEQRDDLARRDIEIEIRHRLDRAVAVRDALDR